MDLDQYMDPMFPDGNLTIDEAFVEVSSEPLYCVCREPYDKNDRKFMIQCDGCKEWFHGACIGLPEEFGQDVDKYHCKNCVPQCGPTIFKEIKNRHRHDYADKDANSKPVQAGTPVFLENLLKRDFPSADDIAIKIRSQQLTLPYLINKGFTRPIIVSDKDGLGIRVPPEQFHVGDVERYVGPDHILDVIDVQRQGEIKMTMHEFAAYFQSPFRSKCLNLISLEFSKTRLSKLVEAPHVARRLDWVETCWSTKDDDRPAVSKYCLVSAKGSYTDFHVDFGGTSVWYHVVWGHKMFYLIEPTLGNLALYKRWMDSSTQYESFFADMVPDKCYRLVLQKGQTLFIPTGWIHAVYTPEDSLVFGGNFLHSLNIDLQLHVYNIERELKVPEKYLFPSLEACHWFAADRLVDDLQNMRKNGHIPAHVLNGAKVLKDTLRTWSACKETGKDRREFIPTGIHPQRIIKDLSREIRIFERRSGLTSGSPKKEEDAKVHKKHHHKHHHVDSHSSVTSSVCTVASTSSGSSSSFDTHVSQRFDGPSSVESSPSSSPKHRIKLTLKKAHSGLNCSSYNEEEGGPLVLDLKETQIAPVSESNPKRLKLRLSMNEKRAEITAESSEVPMITVIDSSEDSSAHKCSRSKKKHKSKGRHNHKVSRDLSNLEDALAGTISGINELISSSNYNERVTSYMKEQPTIKDTMEGLLAIDDEILPSKKRRKHTKKRTISEDSEGLGEETIEKVHQDEDFIYLPLTGDSDSDDAAASFRTKASRKADDPWSPRAKVGHVGTRENRSVRFGAKREAVEKGLENAAAKLATMSASKRKKKRAVEKKKMSKPKSHESKRSHTAKASSSSSSAQRASGSNLFVRGGVGNVMPSRPTTSSTSVTTVQKPKKGFATPKQRLMKKLKRQLNFK